jgi:ubiquinone/menaquinone biosynthesis C-methylase UbiE
MNAETPMLLPAAAAFDAVAPHFDARFGPWKSVDAQRRVVRAALARAFPIGSRVIEIGGGTGLDAQWLVERGRWVLLTDASPTMVAMARARLGTSAAEAVAAEHLARLADRGETFDGAYSNFAALNCVSDMTIVAEGLSRLVRPGGQALLVVFGTCCPGEMVTEAVRGRPANIFRRMARGDVPARLGGHDFTVRYHRRRDLTRAMRPWFRYDGAQAVGLFVPPSAAEPWISGHPRLLGAFEALDRALSRPLAMLGDHILYRFTRTEAPR